MLSIALYLLTHAMLLSLHLSGGSFPRPLSAQEEKKYVERMLAGDIEARNVLVEHNLRLVAHIAKKYYTQSDEQDDLISIGTIGLIKGVSSYRPEKGNEHCHLYLIYQTQMTNLSSTSNTIQRNHVAPYCI